ncbi:glycosyltransferase [Salsipaludibacter albus]|uniref:glycosyltransferase n=1 Tax=Salsipaludibacter albus TaxID=2849650 RepID=UPI001EE41249|nr:glycosyltransferase [Salsipaludibacter albus]MBY5161551.1 glycosyltransferase [Salsipaludibacter albus]
MTTRRTPHLAASGRPAEGPPTRRLVLVVRADPVICGHSVEARNLAEAALQRGFDDVRILTWPVDRLEALGLPLKPADSILAYSPGITVERPDPVGGYKVPDGRHTAGLVGRLVELFTDGVPTVAMSLYLLPHAMVVAEALAAARATGAAGDITTLAEAVGSDITDIARAAVGEGRVGVAAHLFTTYLGNDHCLAVSGYTRDLIVEAATHVDAALGTDFAPRCLERIRVSHPAIDSTACLDLDPRETDRVLARRGLDTDGYVLYLSRLTRAKGVDDLVDGYARCAARERLPLVVAGTGPAADELRARASETAVADRIHFLDDVGDAEKLHLMAGCATYVLPSKPRREFVETFGIALAEEMLAGGGPAITTMTGGIPEAVGDTAIVVPVDHPAAIADAIDWAVTMEPRERAEWRRQAREHALQFDRMAVFDRLLAMVDGTEVTTNGTTAAA